MSTSGNSLIGEDTAKTVASGRETIGAMLSSAQKHLQKVFIVFVLGFLGSFYAMSMVVWPFLEDVTTSGMPQHIMEKVNIVAVTPFDVILLQAKVAMVAGALIALPVLLYLSRDSLRQREWYPDLSISYWKIFPMVVLAIVLFIGGLSYGYSLFFPIMFGFLAENAVNAGFSPNYGIVEWTEFVLVLTLSFGLAAEMPLVMSSLGYTGIVRYETFRDKWRYAVIGIFVFGAFFSPPDPFTQIMWAAPLLVLYAFSLYLTKIVVTIRRGSEEVSLGKTVREKWNHIVGIMLVAAGGTYLFISQGGGLYVQNELLPMLPAEYRPVNDIPTLQQFLGLPRETAIIAVVAAFALLGFVIAVFYFLSASLEAGSTMEPSGAPSALDVDELDSAGVRAAPPEVFEEMSEGESLDHARTAMENDNPDKAQLILDRWDEVNEEDEEEEDPEVREADGAPLAEDVARQQNKDDDGNVVQSTAAGMANAFTDDETTEDDIGGYYYDIAFIFRSLTSKMFRIVGMFMLVLAGVFVWLYNGGIGYINDDFTRRVPQEIVRQGDLLNIVTLHPVEALIFEVKISTLLAAVSVLPMVMYYGWPAMKERKLVKGNRNVFFVWGLALFIGLAVGSAIGYGLIAPTIISWLVTDAHAADMLISYRVKSFFWLVFFTTVGIGLLANIPVSMFLFHTGGILNYKSMRNRWRVFVVGTFAIAGLVTPDSLYTMFLVAIPTSLAYGLGLAILWVFTFGGRRA
ncbi:sec-independent protein translocase protein TatC [Haladaptatus litoreus]|uniref:Sec-independent protein translocase protein TatC n=1 Tax=Haladaptatus litoreus TaxID=553468 RepID=A0A1N7BFV0_9EURY|nr:twin-arginine translocase subunit TatC [Haladaptatus litoreus]SIR50261.1 sec-independent protein translocase protein TatC [Haladaptatus litoreus]